MIYIAPQSANEAGHFTARAYMCTLLCHLTLLILCRVAQ